MNRRYVLGVAATALVALLGIRGDAGAKVSRTACACCGDSCACSKCICDATSTTGTVKTSEGCDCCAGPACCATSTKTNVAAKIN